MEGREGAIQISGGKILQAKAQSRYKEDIRVEIYVECWREPREAGVAMEREERECAVEGREAAEGLTNHFKYFAFFLSDMRRHWRVLN